METFGANLKKARARKRLSLRQLGKLSGCSFSYLHQIESGESKLSLEKAVSIAESLGCSVDDLLKPAPRSTP